MKEKNIKQKQVELLHKPSGTIAIGGNLEKIERKFYNVLLYNAKKQIEENLNKFDFAIPLKELKDKLNTSEDDKNNNYYKKTLNKLYETSVTYNILEKDKIVKGKAHLVDNLDYEINNETKEVRVIYTIPKIIRKAMINIIQGNINGLYAKIDLLVIKGLRSKYSIILYEICKDYENSEIPEMTIGQFKKIFGIENKKSYKLFVHIREKVLDFAVKEINENSDINFLVSYKLKKKGNTYTHIKFITKVKQKQIQLEQYKEKSNIKILTSAIPEEHRTKQLENYLAKCLQNNDAKYLLHQIEYINNQKPKNYFAYLKKAIQDDYANNEKAMIEEERIDVLKKFEAQMNRINDLKYKSIPIDIKPNGKAVYFDGFLFENNNLVVLGNTESDDQMYSLSSRYISIPLVKENEQKIAETLNRIEQILNKPLENEEN
ncbi:MAG: replication initiation protein [Candidatus Rehaiarchaeum fermentans]|nr:replication initiation protein [Candidatus Rehaiarchaeum fermentans]